MTTSPLTDSALRANTIFLGGARRSLALELHLEGTRIILNVVRVEDDRVVLVRRELDDLELTLAGFSREEVNCRLVGVVRLQLERLATLALDRRSGRRKGEFAGAVDRLAADLEAFQGPGAVVVPVGLSGRGCHECGTGDDGCRAGGADEALDRGIHESP
jgi:hypothetical protein